MDFDILTLHPEMCVGPLDHSIIGRARAAGLVDVAVHDIRDHGHGRHRTVDDAPFGGGSGMVLRVDVVAAAIDSVRRAESHVVLLDPAGARFAQTDAARLASHPHLVLVCGHYEGIDARVREHLVDEALSIGDFVLTGGELAAMCIVDAVSRLLPGVLGNPESAATESFSDPAAPLLEAPQFTRPRSFRGWDVPDVLLSGHHAAIDAWREQQAVALTTDVRPDLLLRPAESPAQSDEER